MKGGMMIKKDMLPLYIAIISGVFSVISTIADNLTRNLNANQHIETTSKQGGIMALEIPKEYVRKTGYSIMEFFYSNPKPILFGAVSLIAIIIFLVLKIKKRKRRN
jgi:hypothetical protein